MNSNSNQPIEDDALLITFSQARLIGAEYGELMFKSSPSPENEARLDEILELATISECVDFWIALETLRYGAEQGLTDESALKSYENQKSWLKEYLGMCQMTTAQAQEAMDSLEAMLRNQVEEAERGEIKQIFAAIRVTT